MLLPVLAPAPTDGFDAVLSTARRAMVAREAVLVVPPAQAAERSELAHALVRLGPVRVRGVTDVEQGFKLLDQGAVALVVGEDQHDMIYELPRSRTVVAIRAQSVEAAAERVAELKESVRAVLVEFDAACAVGLDAIKALAATCKEHGVALEVSALAGVALPAADAGLAFYADLERSGINLHMAAEDLLAERPLPFGDLLTAGLVTDRADGLFTTLVVDEHGVALGLVYSDRESICESVRKMRGVYHSRKRGLWYKGDTSGATQDLIRVDADCDADCLRFVVHQNGVGFCHLERYTCFGPGQGIPELMRTLISRRANAPEGSYTKRLFDDPDLLASKLREECEELLAAKDQQEASFETADVIYFALVVAAKHGVTLPEVERQLDRRSLRVRRRPGNAKPPGWKP